MIFILLLKDHSMIGRFQVLGCYHQDVTQLNERYKYATTKEALDLNRPIIASTVLR
mgnify:CR=1 FL=1